MADALSRTPPDSDQLLLLSVPQLDFLRDIQRELEADPIFQELVRNIQRDPSAYPHYHLREGHLLFNGRIWLNKTNPYIPSLLLEFHATPLGGHLGIAKTTHRLESSFFWEGLRHDVKKFIRECKVCQQHKSSTKRMAGLLQPLPAPTGVWEDISMDFITHLPPSHGFTVIFVVVDRFSKGVHLAALPMGFSAFKVATVFLDIVCKHHGFPRSIVSDRDPVFLNTFWKELFRLSGTRLRLSMAYHPQSDGQTEVMNRVLEQYLRCFVSSQPSTWFRYLSLAEWSYNTLLHSSSGLTPFEVIYAKPPPAIPHYIPGSTNNEAVESLVTSRQAIHVKLLKTLQKAQDSMKKYADTKREEVTFSEGQWVYVKLHLARQRSVTGATHSKLSKCYFGPFRILARVGVVAYRLDLPDEARIHPVFHCSLVRPYHGEPPSTTASWPLQLHGHKPIPRPLCVLDTKFDDSTSPPTQMVLVQ